MHRRSRPRSTPSARLQLAPPTRRHRHLCISELPVHGSTRNGAEQVGEHVDAMAAGLIVPCDRRDALYTWIVAIANVLRPAQPPPRCEHERPFVHHDVWLDGTATPLHQCAASVCGRCMPRLHILRCADMPFVCTGVDPNMLRTLTTVECPLHSNMVRGTSSR